MKVYFADRVVEKLCKPEKRTAMQMRVVRTSVKCDDHLTERACVFNRFNRLVLACAWRTVRRSAVAVSSVGDRGGRRHSSEHRPCSRLGSRKHRQRRVSRARARKNTV